MFRATKVMWRRHPKLMIAGYTTEVVAFVVALLSTGSVAWAISAMACVIVVMVFATFRLEEDRGTIDEYVDEVEGRR